MVEQSELGLKLGEQLRTTYLPMEVWYLRSSIEKVSYPFLSLSLRTKRPTDFPLGPLLQAHQMDELDLSSSPSLSSSLDDVFYILKKTLYRMLSTANIVSLVVMTKEVRTVVERDVVEGWRGKLDGAFRDVANGGGGGSVVGGSRAREEEKERREREARGVFIVR